MQSKSLIISRELEELPRSQLELQITKQLNSLGMHSLVEWEEQQKSFTNDGRGYPLNVWSNYIMGYKKSCVRDFLQSQGYIEYNKVTVAGFIECNGYEGEYVSIDDIVLYSVKGRIWVNIASTNYANFKLFISSNMKKLACNKYNHDVRGCEDSHHAIEVMRKRLGSEFCAALKAEGYHMTRHFKSRQVQT